MLVDIPLDNMTIINKYEVCSVVLCSCLMFCFSWTSTTLFYVWMVLGLVHLSMTFSNEDIVKYLPMTLKLGYFFFLFLMASLCWWMFDILCTAGPLFMGIKNDGINSYHLISLFVHHVWIVLGSVDQNDYKTFPKLNFGLGNGFCCWPYRAINS